MAKKHKPDILRTDEFYKDPDKIARKQCPWLKEELKYSFAKVEIPLWEKFVDAYPRLLYLTSVLMGDTSDDGEWEAQKLLIIILNYIYFRNPWAQPFNARELYRQVKIAVTVGKEQWIAAFLEQIRRHRADDDDAESLDDQLEDVYDTKRINPPKKFPALQTTFKV